jgi:(p)ppGpp synthase/HD superfamily hydrolase
VEAHKDNEENQEAYIFHPIAVAKLSLLKLDWEQHLSPLLHDVVEDTPTTVKT